jgi:dTDP-4-amino-4,6-dideoxygalactose transaminase
MDTTSSEAVWRAAWSLKDHGRDPDLAKAPHDQAGFRWLIGSFGTNWRMLEIQAAVGLVQLGKLASWVARRRENARILSERFSALPALRVATPPSHVSHAYYKYHFFVRPERLRPGWDRDRLLSSLLVRGVPASVGACPEIYREKAFVDAGLAPSERLPVARRVGETSLWLPVHPTLEEDDVRRMAAIVEETVQEASL